MTVKVQIVSKKRRSALRKKIGSNLNPKEKLIFGLIAYLSIYSEWYMDMFDENPFA